MRDLRFLKSPTPSSNPSTPPHTNAPMIHTDTGWAAKLKFANEIATGVVLKYENVMLAMNTSIRKRPENIWASLRIYRFNWLDAKKKRQNPQRLCRSSISLFQPGSELLFGQHTDVDAIPQFFSGFEMGYILSTKCDRRASLWVTANSWHSVVQGETTKSSNLNPATFSKNI